RTAASMQSWEKPFIANFSDSIRLIEKLFASFYQKSDSKCLPLATVT
ncbi:MAG: hypothetical protein ACJA0I_001233, partial [Gammaproteobacteria bacterium]